ncbi:hypothetical protein Nepgr_027002 [Nepenthes gracilis]|uniref:Uncharacterized protein n=1 Tax=Nepenthes gracilis TaxID=150966 RepID=A0AAD3TA26_NEPGR|nr:hypothetical protein Nepgr_027002 [Nepenthes gracilis]
MMLNIRELNFRPENCRHQIGTTMQHTFLKLRPNPKTLKGFLRLATIRCEGKKLQSLDGLVQELKPLDDKTRDLGPLETKLQDACPIPRRVDVMKLTIENGPNFVQLVSYATSSCDLSPGFEMTIRIPDVRTRITLQIKEEIMLWESLNGVALSISFSSWWQPHHDRISLPYAIWHFPSLVLLEGCDDVQSCSCYAIET